MLLQHAFQVWTHHTTMPSNIWCTGHNYPVGSGSSRMFTNFYETCTQPQYWLNCLLKRAAVSRYKSMRCCPSCLLAICGTNRLHHAHHREQHPRSLLQAMQETPPEQCLGDWNKEKPVRYCYYSVLYINISVMSFVFHLGVPLTRLCTMDDILAGRSTPSTTPLPWLQVAVFG